MSLFFLSYYITQRVLDMQILLVQMGDYYVKNIKRKIVFKHSKR